MLHRNCGRHFILNNINSMEESHSPSSLDPFQATKDWIYHVGIDSNEPQIDPLYT